MKCADINLIDAAPDLLECVKELLKHMDTILYFGDGSVVDLSELETVHTAKALIAKIEGGAV